MLEFPDPILSFKSAQVGLEIMLGVSVVSFAAFIIVPWLKLRARLLALRREIDGLGSNGASQATSLERFLSDVSRKSHRGFPRPRKSDSGSATMNVEISDGQGILEGLAGTRGCDCRRR